jgi:dihydrofolate synthase/folylpolyglutamate synthase
VGLGGRLDATNVVPAPRAAAITRIALDHTDRLGTTLVEIAREKAGIAKANLDLLLGAMPPDVRRAIDQVAHAHGATTSSVDDEIDRLSRGRGVALAGDHQKDNARIAAALADRIGASTVAIDDGLADVRWPGRLERLADARLGDVLLDAAHNPDGAAALAAHVRSLAIPPADVALVFGALADKDWAPMLDALAPLATRRVYVAPHGASRNAVDPAAMAARHAGDIAPTVERALALARQAPAARSTAAHPTALPPRLTLLCGSLVLVGEARAQLLGLPRDPPVAL